MIDWGIDDIKDKIKFEANKCYINKHNLKLAFDL